MSAETDAKRAFLEVAEAPPGEREGALRRACADNGALRARVEQLLVAHDEAEREGAGPPSADGDALALPERIGEHRVIRRLGAGGMGVVYEAEQQRPRRRIAVKVLHPWLLSRESRGRFRNEADLLARLRHPGLAHVHEAGEAPIVMRGGAEADPLPYIAMELIPGAVPVTRHADAAGLGVRARVELMAAVCDAVHAAHQQGVIHRDLKPGNILVGEDGLARVIDFGVARASAGGAATLTMHTSPGQLVGTLAYMSPEQCAGDASEADARSDVYSLGVVLYDLVCGRLPYDLAGLGLTQVLRAIEEREARPATGRGVGRDLEAVMLKAIAKRPEARYTSAADLARELRRVLAGEPVEARAPGRWARLARWIGRHPLAATGAACAAVVLLSLAGTGAGIYWLALRPDHLLEYGDPRYLALRSRGGHNLHIWDAGPDGRTVFWTLADRHESLGGGRLALIGFQFDSRQSAEPGHVEAFDVSDPDRRVWSTRDTPLRSPGAYAERRDIVPAIERAFLADIFDEVPGPELVLLHALGGSSPTAIRIFDLEGRARYEAWHEGAVLMARWLPGARRLVLCGLNSEARWDQRGVDLREPLYPCFVAAVEPRDGHRPTGTWLVEGGRRTDPTLAWYRWLGPIDELRRLPRVGTGLVRAGAGWDDGTHFTLSATAVWSGGPGGLLLTLDADGRIVARASDDHYKLGERAGEVPPIEAFELLEYEALPPATPSGE